MVKRFLVFAALAVTAVLAHAATMEDEVRAVFDKYIAVQNAHDLKRCEAFWRTRRTYCGSAGANPSGVGSALKSLEERYKGTWRIDADRKEFDHLGQQARSASLCAHATHRRRSGRRPSKARLYINLVMVKKARRLADREHLAILVPPQ